VKSEMKRYLHAQYYIPVIAFFFIFLYILLLLTGEEVPGQSRGNTFNKSGSGYFFFYKLFKRLDYKFERWYEAEPPGESGCLVYFDYFPGDKEILDRVVKWVKQGNVLFLAGINADYDPIRSRKVAFGPSMDVEISKSLGAEVKPLPFSFSGSQYFKSLLGDSILMRSESGALLIERSLGRGRVFLFADNNLFVNRNFINENHAVFLNLVFKPYYKKNVYIYEYGTGVQRVKNPVLILFKGDLLVLTLHLFLMGILFAAWKGKRFGKPLQAEPFKRRSLSLHLAAVGDFYQKARALRIVESLTRKYFIYRVKHILNLKKNIPIDQLVETLSGYTGKSPGKIRVLLEEPGGVPEKMLFMKRKEISELIAEIENYKK